MQVMNAATAQRAARARSGKNRLKGVGHPTTANMDYSPREQEFMFAMHEYTLATGHKFPTWSQALRVLDSLGYKQVGRTKVAVSAEAA